MKHNVVLCVDQESSYFAAGKKTPFVADQMSTSSTLGVCLIL